MSLKIFTSTRFRICARACDLQRRPPGDKVTQLCRNMIFSGSKTLNLVAFSVANPGRWCVGMLQWSCSKRVIHGLRVGANIVGKFAVGLNCWPIFITSSENYGRWVARSDIRCYGVNVSTNRNTKSTGDFLFTTPASLLHLQSADILSGCEHGRADGTPSFYPR